MKPIRPPRLHARRVSLPVRAVLPLLPTMLCLGHSPHALGQISSVAGPIPVGPDSVIYGSATVPGAKHSISLKPYGYIEEEFFISGQAAAYRRGAAGPEKFTADLPYTSRIVVRRPADPARFSGVVHFEPYHPTGGVTFQWSALKQYLMSRGDIYVAADLGDADAGHSGSPKYPGHSAPVGQHKVTKWFDPKRYAPLQWPQEEGIRWQVMSDVGRKLRSADTDNPLRDLNVRAMLVAGWSYTGSLQRTFINEGFHELARLADGKPVFDGYLLGVSSSWNSPGYLPLYNDEPFVPIGDPRRLLKPTDAKVFEFLSEAEVEMGNGKPIPEGTGPRSGFRLYELAGVIHVASLVDPTDQYREEPNLAQLIARNYPLEMIPTEHVDQCSLTPSDVPQGAFLRAAVDNLRHWVLDGRSPPPSTALARADDKLVRDPTGNVLGGIRAAEFDVPVAYYGRYRGQDKPECSEERNYPFVFFLRNELPREDLLRRYSSAERYLALYGKAVDKLVKERWLLPEDALRLKAKAREDALRLF